MEKKTLIILVVVILLALGLGYMMINQFQKSGTADSQSQSTSSEVLTTEEIDSLTQGLDNSEGVQSELDIEDINLEINLD